MTILRPLGERSSHDPILIAALLALLGVLRLADRMRVRLGNGDTAAAPALSVVAA